MNYTIKHVSFFVRETLPARFPSALGKAAQAGKPPEHVTSPLCHCRIVVADSAGDETFGCSADRLSVRWLDKRPGRSESLKRRELAAMIEAAGKIYLAEPAFDAPFAKWRACHKRIEQQGRAAGQEQLTAAFASALLERAMLDGVARLAGKPLFAMFAEDRLGFRPEQIHPELRGMRPRDYLPAQPRSTIFVRHTIGIYDPLTAHDWPEQNRLNDGLPETVEDYVRTDGVRYFKIKISGDVDADLDRLARIWEILPLQAEPVITLDANEAFEDVAVFAQFVERLEQEQLGLFQHIEFIEQPLPRSLALDDRAGPSIRRIAAAKPVIIDESDSSIGALKRARQLGYSGTSHKNCKGVFKSVMNKALAVHYAERGEAILLSGEDLQNLPVVPLQQDFAAVALLDIPHCERNGHHYNFGLSMLSAKDKAAAGRRHPDLYARRGDEWFLNVKHGAVDCASLHCPGFGVFDEPDWQSMDGLRDWLERRHPAKE